MHANEDNQRLITLRTGSNTCSYKWTAQSYCSDSFSNQSLHAVTNILYSGKLSRILRFQSHLRKSSPRNFVTPTCMIDLAFHESFLREMLTFTNPWKFSLKSFPLYGKRFIKSISCCFICYIIVGNGGWWLLPSLLLDKILLRVM